MILKMSEYLSGTDTAPYGFKYMKEKILEDYGDKIIITEIDGKPNIVTMWSKASTILHEFYSCPKSENSESEKLRMITTVVKLIKNDIKSVSQKSDTYPGA